jgi:hypothetical protein
MERSHSNPRLQQTKDPPSGAPAEHNPFEGPENEGVVGDEETDPGRNRRTQHFFSDFMADPDPPGGSIRITDLEAVAIP